MQLIKELLLDKEGSTQLSEADKEALAKSIHQYNSTSKLHEHDMRQSRQADLINQRLIFAFRCGHLSYSISTCSFDEKINEPASLK